jgi:hypothetical protein
MARKNNIAGKTMVDEKWFSRYGLEVRRCLLDELDLSRRGSR